METGFMNRIIGLVLALVVGGLLVGGLLIPSIEGMTATEKTFDNSVNAQGYMIPIGLDTESYSMVFDSTSPGKVVVNGEDVPLYDGTILAVTDNGLIRCTSTSGTALGVVRAGDNTNNISSLNLTITNGVLSYTHDGSTPYTVDISAGGYALAKTGPYVMTSSTQDIYLKGDTEVYASGLTNTVGAVWNTNYQIEGTIVDGVTIAVNYPTNHTFAFENISINTTAVSRYVDLYKLTSITFDTIVDDDPTKLTHCTYNRIIVPAEVTAELSQHMSTTEIAMFGVISILGIVALVVVAANGIRNKY